MILESSLQKEYDRGNNQGGGFAYPMPFGYPMMGSHPNNDNNFAKLKTLEIDLATERASKDMLENVIQDLRTTHDQEKETMQSQYSSLVLSHEEETSELLAQVGEKRAEVDLLHQELSSLKSAKASIARQLDDTMNEMSDLKEQLVQTSCELSSTMEEKAMLSSTVSGLEKVKEDLVQTREDLHKTTAELKVEREALRRKESEGEYLRDENTRLKKEYSEAIVSI